MLVCVSVWVNRHVESAEMGVLPGWGVGGRVGHLKISEKDNEVFLKWQGIRGKTG